MSDPQGRFPRSQHVHLRRFRFRYLRVGLDLSSCLQEFSREKEELLQKKIETAKIGIRKTEQENKNTAAERKDLLQSLLERFSCGGPVQKNFLIFWMN